MKSAFAIASVLATVNAQTIVTTSNECWKGQGGDFTGNCDSVYYHTCDNYEIRDKCNVFTFSDSRLEWKGAAISVHYWSYYLSSGSDQDTEINSGHFDGGVCYPLDSVPTAYENGIVMNHTGGMCGFKYLVTNSDPNGFAQFIKVMKDNS
jgi:hypothetical protein